MLDNDQKLAVEAPFKNTLVIANAGSGKTRVLTYRVKHLIEKGIFEDEIILLTFTNKASKEMIERVNNLLGLTVNLVSGTFHHVAVVFLKKYGPLIGLDRNFLVLPMEESKDLMALARQNYLKVNPSINKKDIPNKSVLYSLNSEAINKNLPLLKVCIDGGFNTKTYEHIERILLAYTERKEQQNALDFDDLIVKFAEMLENDEIRGKINRKYKYVLVDEYQDINWIQNSIIEGLNGSGNLFVCGDSEQGIYSFRGAKSEFITNFEDNHPGCNVYQIRYNYRSQGSIVKMAENSINNNVLKYKKEMIPFLPLSEKPAVIKSGNEKDQGKHIAKKVKEYVADGIPYSEMAILFRTNGLTKSVEMALSTANIPYKVIGGIPFFERAHIRDMLSVLRFVINPKDEVSFSRVLDLFSGLGIQSIEALFYHLRSNEYNIYSLNPMWIPFKLPAPAFDGLTTFFEIITQIMDEPTIEGKMQNFFTNYYDNYLRFKDDEYKDRAYDVNVLISTAKGYEDIDVFLDDMALEIDKEDSDQSDYVSLMSIHKAKGLEWDVVFMPYVVDSILPHHRSIVEDDIEEERRLFYVALTRARKHLYLYQLMDMVFKQNTFAYSRFIRELDRTLYDYISPPK